MNKNRIATGIGVVLLTTGIIGGIWSGIDAMPTVFNNIQTEKENSYKEEVIYKSELKLTKLNVDSNISGVIIKRYNGKDVVVERNGNKELSNITTKENNDELIIKEEYRESKKFTESIDDIVRYFVNKLYSAHYSDITVYVPNDIDLDIKTNNGRLYINEDIALNNVNFDTQYGSISIDNSSKIKNLDIRSDADISLQVSEVYCVDNINVESNFISINEDNNARKNVEIPESFSISTYNDYYENSSVSINTTLPIAKNLNIDTKSTTMIDLPLLDYKFNFDVKTSRGVGFNSDNLVKYVGTPLEKYFSLEEEYDDYEGFKRKELIGVVNEDMNGETTQYNVNIKSAVVVFN